MKEIVWLSDHRIFRWQRELIETFGGAPGLIDRGLLESALAKPRHLLAYEENASLPQLAAAYAVGLARNHPFVDGNKRIGFAAMAAFLKVNGLVLDSSEGEAAEVMASVANGDTGQAALAGWIEARILRA